MSSDAKQIMQTILDGMERLFVVIAKNFYNLSFIFVWFFVLYNPLLTIVFSIILLVGFIKTQSYKYIKW